MSNQYQRRDAGAVEAATDAALPQVDVLLALLKRCIPAVQDAEHLAREVHCAEGVAMYRALLNDIEQEM